MFDLTGVATLMAGGGGLIGMSMAGVGAYRFFKAGADQIKVIPAALVNGVEQLGKLRLAIENDQSLRMLMVEQAGLLREIREDVHTMKDERTEIGRELRLMSRRIEEMGDAGGEN